MQRGRIVGRVAERGAQFAPSRNLRHDSLGGRGVDRGHRAFRRVLQIDDVGAEPQGDVGLCRVCYAGQHSGHRSLLSFHALGSRRLLRPARRRILPANADRCGLKRRRAAPMLGETRIRPCWPARAQPLPESCLIASPQAFAQGRPKADPDWPCHQVKTPTFSLASVWSGPDCRPEFPGLAQRPGGRRSRNENVASGACRSRTWKRRFRQFKARQGADAKCETAGGVRRGVPGPHPAAVASSERT